MEPKSPHALVWPPIVIAVMTLLLTATAASGECPSADLLMESQVNRTSFMLAIKNGTCINSGLTKSHVLTFPIL